ncbi:hypothetical protein EIP91_011169 [Steccherinum ochraceum]|uniref:Lethal giant larvae (Lgl)-like C-terminal domain-containing protein n=1 Tax=Steccherinum ochraceum TaxID=92696 RepID=A0A4R0RIA5_9APHY|nr:hypothetical protein EIP91_011169 [Steccherinum ochraceum]
MFSRHNDKSIVELSAELNDEVDWQVGILRRLPFYLNVCAFAFEPVVGLLAFATTSGDVELYGAPGVHVRLSVSDNARINLLQFATSLSRLLCVDEHDRLHVWDLVTPGKPRLQKIVNYRHPVTALGLSPTHQHVFVALANGEIQTYDLLCSRVSPYTIPNMWKMYEKKMRASRPTSSFNDDDSVSQIPLDLMIHPRDLNLLFVVYGGGIVLSDLTQRNTLRVYELELPPGAPGGAGYHAPDILTHRKPSVTSFAIHPSGHFFAVGHADGSVSFWAMEDEDKPLLVRTLDDEDVHLVDADSLTERLSSPSTASLSREPIFKLAWSGCPGSSDPRGGETVLTILGGLRNDEPPGVTVYLLPPFNPGEPPTPADPSAGLHPFFKTAMKESLIPTNVFTYFTKGVTQDFLLVPRDSPHFSGTWDPVSILLMSEHKGGTRAIEAYQFPPPAFATKSSNQDLKAAGPLPESEDTVSTPIDVLSNELATTLEFMQVTDDPHVMKLPTSLWNGQGGVLDGQLIAIERDAYEIFVDIRGIERAHELNLHGGTAWVEDFQSEMKLMKLQPHRIFMTIHGDLTVRFQDMSAQLLISSDASPLHQFFPNPLHALTLDLTCVLGDPAIATRTSAQFIDQARIASAHLAPESLECAVVLRTGEDEEFVSLDHIPTILGCRFRPAFAILAVMGSVTSFAISDIGFLAVAYASGALFIVDMRGPKILLRYAPESKSSFLHRKDHLDPFTSLVFTVSGTSTDPSYRVLLIAAHDSGSSTVWTILRGQNSSWTVKDATESADAMSRPLPGGSIVVDSRTGNPCRANRGGLATVMASSPDEFTSGEGRQTLWISAGARGVKCTVNVTGERVQRVDWNSKAGKVERVEVIHKNSAAALAAYTDKHQVLIYSLPFLELLHTLQLEHSSADSIVFDTTGDYLEFTRHPSSGLISGADYGTLFNIRRSGPYEPPSVTFMHDRRIIPAQPQSVSVGPTSYIGSWIGYIVSQGMTGQQIDALLAGPDRPLAQPTPKDPRAVVQDASSGGGSTSGGSAYDAYSAQAQGMATSAANTASDLYSRLGAAFAERTEGLGELQESFDSLEQGSKKMLFQSKALAAQQTAKRWFGGL